MAEGSGIGGGGGGARRVSGGRASRPQGPEVDTLPVVLRSAEWGRITAGRFGPSWSKRFVQCKWVVSGEAAMRVGGRRVRMGAGDVAVYLPQIEHAFWVIRDESEICWFTVDGPLCESYAQLLGLRAGVYRFGEPPVGVIKEMCRVLEDQSFEGRLRGSEMAITMLHEVARRVPRPVVSDAVQQVRHLIIEGMSDPELSAKGIARALGYNRSALSELFRRQTGRTIMESITEARLREAEVLLKDGGRRVGDVARMCGFRDASYFTRWVRKHTGRRPGEARGEGRKSE